MLRVRAGLVGLGGAGSARGCEMGPGVLWVLVLGGSSCMVKMRPKLPLHGTAKQ